MFWHGNTQLDVPDLHSLFARTSFSERERGDEFSVVTRTLAQQGIRDGDVIDVIPRTRSLLPSGQLLKQIRLCGNGISQETKDQLSMLRRKHSPSRDYPCFVF
uniref:Uncharacterized protein n=1 Tax=Prymnesium polylepis TaxID=72548 RepID=A0A7S4HGA7_9EUKA